jgi:hypothetical protein
MLYLQQLIKKILYRLAAFGRKAGFPFSDRPLEKRHFLETTLMDKNLPQQRITAIV